MNGWTNHETWNVALHINNNMSLYWAAVKFAKNAEDVNYQDFIRSIGYEDSRTSDGVDWISDKLDYAELDEMLWEMAVTEVSRDN